MFFKISRPLVFESNHGQAGTPTHYLCKGRDFTALFQTGSVVFDPAALRLHLVGGNSLTLPVSEGPLEGKLHYYLGKNAASWYPTVPTASRVRYRNVYPGIDWLFHSQVGQLKSDFVVAPGADPRTITQRFRGARQLQIDSCGNLIVRTARGEWRQQRPTIYQEINGEPQTVCGGYVLRGTDQVGFDLGRYDSTKPLLIDPVVVFATYAGSDTGDNVLVTVACDAAGNVYLAGTNTVQQQTTPFTITSQFIFVLKLNPAGNLVHGIHLGGLKSEALAVAADAHGNFYVTGSTTFAGFPIVNPLPGMKMGTQGAFLTKFNPAGQIVFSTFLGGSKTQEGRALALDPAGNVYVAGRTTSTDFPITGGFQAQNRNPQEIGFLVKLAAANNTVIYSSYLGGTTTTFAGDVPSGLAVDSDGNAYVTGAAGSSDFPTVNAVQSTLKGSQDAFVTKVSIAGDRILYSTLLGGTNATWGKGIAVDAQGSALMVGQTASLDYPSDVQPQFPPDRDYAIATRLNPAGNTRLFSSYLCEGDAYQVSLDKAGNSCVVGSTSSATFATTPDALPVAMQQFGDTFLMRLDAQGRTKYATLLGTGSSGINAAGIAVDAGNNILIAGTVMKPEQLQNPVNAFKPNPGSGPHFDAFVLCLGEPGSLQFASARYDGQVKADSFVPITITVVRVGGTVGTVSVTFATQQGTASPNVDYLSVQDTLTFGPGDMSKTFTVNLLPSSSPRGDRTVHLVLSEPGGASLGDVASATLTIHDAPGVVEFMQSAFTFQDGAGSVDITVTRSGGLGDGITVEFATEVPGTGTPAIVGTDFQATVPQTLTFAPQQAQTKAALVILANPLAQDNRTVGLVLRSPTGGTTLGNQARAILVINHG